MDKLLVDYKNNIHYIGNGLSGNGYENPVSVSVNEDKRELLWSANEVNTNYSINLSSPIWHYENVIVYCSGQANENDYIKSSKNIYPSITTEQQNCDGYASLRFGKTDSGDYVHNAEITLSGNSGYIGQSNYMGMRSGSTGYSAGFRTETSASQVLTPYKIYGYKHRPIYSLHINEDYDKGTVSSNYNSGCEFDTIILKDIPAEGYYISSYNITGSDLDIDRFKFNTNDVEIEPIWSNSPVVRYVSLVTDGNGTISANKTTGYANESINLLTVPNENYEFNHYECTGGTIIDNTFIFNICNATISAYFNALSSILYSFTGDYTGNVFSTPVDLTNATGDYIGIKFEYKNTAPSYGAGGWQILFNNASWRTRYRHGQGNHTLLKQQPFQYVNTATVGWYNVDSTNNYYSKLYNCTDFHPVKLICKRTEGDVSAFVENVYHGHQELNVSVSSMTFNQYNETSVGHTARNVDIAQFASLDQAVLW